MPIGCSAASPGPSVPRWMLPRVKRSLSRSASPLSSCCIWRPSIHAPSRFDHLFLPQVLTVLASASDQRSIENELVLSLGFEQFELIKELIKNRLRIVWCTKLSRAQVNS